MTVSSPPSSSGPPLKRARRVEIVLLLVAVAVCATFAQLVTYWAIRAEWGPDGMRYALVGVNFLQRHPFDMTMVYDRLWVHPVIALGVAKTFSSGAAWPLLQQIVYALLLIPTFLVIRRAFGFLAAGLITLALAVNQPFLSTTRVWSSEGIFGLAIWGTSLCYLHFLHRPRHRSAVAAGFLAALLPVIRPTAEYWVVIFLAGALLVRMKRKYVAIFVASFLIPTLLVLGLNKVRFGFFGYTWKLGRMAFLRVWDQDKSFSPDNGPESRRLYEFMEQRWPEVRQRNPRSAGPYPTWDSLYRESLRRPGAAYHGALYYLIVHEVRSQMPQAEADRLLRSVALEAFLKDPGPHLKNTLRFSLVNLGLTQERPRFFMAPQPSPIESALSAESAAEGEPREWHFEPLPSYGQSEQQWKEGYAKANADLYALWSGASSTQRAWAVKWNNRLRLLVPPQKVVILLAFIAAVAFAVKALRKREAGSVWVLVIALLVFSHPAAIALFYGALEMHNIPMIPCELILAVLGVACLVSSYRSLQARWETAACPRDEEAKG